MNVVPAPLALLLAAFAANFATQSALAQSQAFTYQGELRDGTNVAQGPHDLRFELLDEGGRTRLTLCADDVPVVDGLFTVRLDPDNDFPNILPLLRSIRILVRANSNLPCSDSSGFTALSPDQPFSRTPLASRASIADRAITADTFAGQLPSFYTDAANLSGTLSDSRLSGNVPRLASDNIFSGTTKFNGFIGIGLGNAVPSFPIEIVNSQAQALFSTNQSLNGSVLILSNETSTLPSSGALLGAVNFNRFGATPGQIAYRFDPASTLDHSLQFRVGDVTQAALTGDGRFGIGKATPQFPLDIAAPQAIAKLATSNSQSGSILSLSNGSPVLSTNGGTLGAINFESAFGTDGQIAYQWDAFDAADDALQFRVGGQPLASLTGRGSLGVGVLDPAARLHVRNGSASVPPQSNSTMIMETAGGGYFNLITQNAFETGILFGKPSGGPEDAGIIYNNPSTPRGLQFRTGGNLTRMSITDTGAVIIPGTLVSGITVIEDVQYATPKVTFANIAPADFSIVTLFNTVSSLSSGEFITIPSGFVNDQLIAPVHLPHGAVVTQIIVLVYDNSATKNLTAQFIQTDQLTRAATLRGTGTSGTSSILNQFIDCTPISNLTINNQNSLYRIAVSTANSQPWDGNLGVAGVRIEYQMSSPIP